MENNNSIALFINDLNTEDAFSRAKRVFGIEKDEAIININLARSNSFDAVKFDEVLKEARNASIQIRLHVEINEENYIQKARDFLNLSTGYRV